jgi:hypothetical protein
MEREILEAMMAATVAPGTLAATMGITIVSASGTQVVATMPVAGNIQPFGLLHGGASCVLAETVGSLGAAVHAGPGAMVVGIEINPGARRPDAGYVRHRYLRRRRSPGVHVTAYLPDQGPGTGSRGKRSRRVR